MVARVEQGLMGNLLKNVPRHSDEELVEKLLSSPNCRIERIVSTGQASPVGYWYDQKESEWILVVTGNASIGFEDGTEKLLTTGDYLNIPAGMKHRVNWTSADEPTVWLAIFYEDNDFSTAATS